MSMSVLQGIESLQKALEAGGYNVAPDRLTQGSALQIEDMSKVMELVTYEDKHLKLVSSLKVDPCKSMLAQFNRQLSYGQWGGGAQLEGNIGQDETSEYVRITVPMCFYSESRRYTIAAELVDTFDGKKADSRVAADAALHLAGQIEFDSFRGRSDFSNAGVFDGNPAATPTVMADMWGVDYQVRQSDARREDHDQMFSSYGSDDTVVIFCGSTMTQDNIEDATTRSAMNMGNADALYVDPKVLSAYNKITYGKERIVLAGSPQEATGAELRKQWVSTGMCSIESSRFLSGKTKPFSPRATGPAAPSSIASVTSTTVSGVVTSFVAGEVYQYYATSGNEVGESTATAAVSGTVAVTGDEMVVVINNPSGTVRWLNVYRTKAGGAAATAKFIGRVAIASGGTTTFTDLNNKSPGSVNGILIEKNCLGFKELSPYSELKLAVSDLSTPQAFFRFITLAAYQPRKLVVLDNLNG